MSTDKKPPQRLGRGLNSLLTQPVVINQTKPDHVPATELDRRSVIAIPTSALAPNPNQPRRIIDDIALRELAASLQSTGMMQPILARRSGNTYEIIAGERRWRAAMLAGLDSVPVLLADLSDLESAEWAIIENVQREDLSPMDRAAAYKQLCDRFSLTHAEVAAKVGIDRSTVSNLIRLLDLEPEVQSLIERPGHQDENSLSTGHAKVLLSFPPGPDRVALARRVAAEGWSVRRLERHGATKRNAAPLARQALEIGREEGGWDAGLPAERENALTELERQLGDHLGTKVSVWTDRKGGKGRLSIEFYSLEHFDGLMHKFGFVMR